VEDMGTCVDEKDKSSSTLEEVMYSLLKNYDSMGRSFKTWPQPLCLIVSHPSASILPERLQGIQHLARTFDFEVLYGDNFERTNSNYGRHLLAFCSLPEFQFVTFQREQSDYLFFTCKFAESQDHLSVQFSSLYRGQSGLRRAGCRQPI